MTSRKTSERAGFMSAGEETVPGRMRGFAEDDQ